MAAIDFPTATSNGQTFEADSGVIYTYVGTPPNGFWSGTFGTTGLTNVALIISSILCGLLILRIYNEYEKV